MIKWKNKRWQHVGRFLVVLLCISAFIGMLEYGAKLNQKYYQLLSDQSQILSRVIVHQAANSAAKDIADNNNDALENLVQHISDEPLILDATIYNLEGIALASTKNAMPLEQVIGLSTPLAIASIGRQQIVEPIFNDDQIIGFFRITLEHDKLLTHVNNQLSNMTNIIRGLIVTALIIGLLLAFTFIRRKDIWHFPLLSAANKD